MKRLEDRDRRDDCPTNSDFIRAFVAIQLPAEVRANLAEAQAAMRALLPPKSASWTKAENLHLTLRFLGNVETARIAELSQLLRDALANFGELDLACEQVGCFPDVRHPRVIWAWMHDAADRLEPLHRQVNEAVKGFAAHPAEKGFVGHVTLGRPKRLGRLEAERLAQFVERQAGKKFGAWRCASLSLIRSELSPQGSRYTTLDVLPL